MLITYTYSNQHGYYGNRSIEDILVGPASMFTTALVVVGP